ncbi:probable metal-nicotianamine transporter YSL7 [Eucalyptus grandis]|uniref:probable metal-nicotianamine transporter YSL7 n=1 Tax=Eucalyptus grandis TaxID=71139 RepID=UPI00192E7A13|nr:probable metal-nicotianamine transporter YSL7 [Eucalyptus grandis]
MKRSREELHSVEFILKGKEIPPWQRQLTLRALVVSCAMGAFLTIYLLKMDLMLNFIPPANLFAGGFGFVFISTWTKLVNASGLLSQPFTRQENTIIHTCVDSFIGIALSGGFSSYLLAMSDTVAKQIPGPVDSYDIKNPSLGWMILFLFLASCAGLLSLLPLRKFMLIDKKLTYPTGYATGNVINSFHTPQIGKLNGRKQGTTLSKFFTISFFGAVYQWLFSGGSSCGFHYFPTFGLKAFQRSFHFDFHSSYIGVGMMCPFIIAYSQLLGAILSSGILWPFMETKKGDWYPADAAVRSLSGRLGYRVFLSLAIITGDAVYHMIKAVVIGLFMHKKIDNAACSPFAKNPFHEKSPVSYDEEVRTEIFLEDLIPDRVAVGSYIVISVISTVVFPFIFPPLKWYYILIIYMISPVLGFCKAYSTGLTDMSITSNLGKLAMIIFASWARKARGSVLVGLVACGIVMNLVDVASNVMESFKVGYMTLSSPKSLLLSKLIGILMGCVISPSIFLYLRSRHPRLGTSGSQFSAAWSSSFREASMHATSGFSMLPKHCLEISLAFFLAAILINLLRDWTPKKWRNLIPIPVAFAIPFYIGAYITIDMCVGYLILYVWRRKNKEQAETFAPFVGSALVFGDGLWLFPASVLKMKKITAPMCMRFWPQEMSSRVENCLSSGS